MPCYLVQPSDRRNEKCCSRDSSVFTHGAKQIDVDMKANVTLARMQKRWLISPNKPHHWEVAYGDLMMPDDSSSQAPLSLRWRIRGASKVGVCMFITHLRSDVMRTRHQSGHWYFFMANHLHKKIINQILNNGNLCLGSHLTCGFTSAWSNAIHNGNLRVRHVDKESCIPDQNY